MAYDADKIIEVATRLKEAREEVTHWEEKLRMLVMPQHILSIPKLQEPTVPDRVVEFFDADPGRSFSAEDVWKKLSIKESYARPLLSRLVTAGRIEKRGRGHYGAVGGSKQKSLESADSRPLQ